MNRWSRESPLFLAFFGTSAPGRAFFFVSKILSWPVYCVGVGETQRRFGFWQLRFYMRRKASRHNTGNCRRNARGAGGMVKALCLSARRHFCKESTESEGFLSLWHTGWCTNLSLYSAEIPWQHFDMNASSVLYGWEKSFPELAINPIYRTFCHV